MPKKPRSLVCNVDADVLDHSYCAALPLTQANYKRLLRLAKFAVDAPVALRVSSVVSYDSGLWPCFYCDNIGHVLGDYDKLIGVIDTAELPAVSDWLGTPYLTASVSLSVAITQRKRLDRTEFQWQVPIKYCSDDAIVQSFTLEEFREYLRS